MLFVKQSKLWKIDQIQAVMADIGVDYTAVVGVQTQKPDTTLFLGSFPKFEPTKAYYVGDAAGRPGDWSDKDKEFAHALGTKFFTPEDMFPLEARVKPAVKPSAKKEVVIMVGYPASGKSTIAKTELAPYHRVDGDSLKTAAAMVKDAEKHIGTQSVVFDSTAGTRAKRAEFVNFAKKHDLPVRVFWVQTPIEVAMERNKQRQAEGGAKIPDIVFYVYRKNFEEPTEAEGFTLVKIPS
jgi:bifunctional polynucleotide phosphatase/kinase